jgi:proteic killer suppression protein
MTSYCQYFPRITKIIESWILVILRIAIAESSVRIQSKRMSFASPLGGCMDVEFSDDDLCRLECDPDFSGGHSQAIVRAFRKCMQVIRAAADERDFYSLKSLHYKKLQGKRSQEKSMRLNDQWRLILEVQSSKSKTVVLIKGIEDYH